MFSTKTPSRHRPLLLGAIALLMAAPAEAEPPTHADVADARLLVAPGRTFAPPIAGHEAYDTAFQPAAATRTVGRAPEAPAAPRRSELAMRSHGERSSTSLRVGFQTKAGAPGVRELLLQHDRAVQRRVSPTDGLLTRSEAALVTHRLQTRTTSLQECYRSRLRARPGLRGRVVLRLLIGANGSVGAVDVVDNTTGDGTMGRCLATQIQLLRFSPPANGPATFTYPIYLSTI